MDKLTEFVDKILVERLFNLNSPQHLQRLKLKRLILTLTLSKRFVLDNFWKYSMIRSLREMKNLKLILILLRNYAVWPMVMHNLMLMTKILIEKDSQGVTLRLCLWAVSFIPNNSITSLIWIPMKLACKTFLKTAQRWFLLMMTILKNTKLPLMKRSPCKWLLTKMDTILSLLISRETTVERLNLRTVYMQQLSLKLKSQLKSNSVRIMNITKNKTTTSTKKWKSTKRKMKELKSINNIFNLRTS